jgi:hypothetical protein
VAGTEQSRGEPRLNHVYHLAQASEIAERQVIHQAAEPDHVQRAKRLWQQTPIPNVQPHYDFADFLSAFSPPVVGAFKPVPFLNCNAEQILALGRLLAIHSRAVAFLVQ